MQCRVEAMTCLRGGRPGQDVVARYVTVRSRDSNLMGYRRSSHLVMSLGPYIDGGCCYARGTLLSLQRRPSHWHGLSSGYENNERPSQTQACWINNSIAPLILKHSLITGLTTDAIIRFDLAILREVSVARRTAIHNHSVTCGLF